MKKGRKKSQSLPEWFPLPVYEQTLGGEEWLEELLWRYMARHALEQESKESGLDYFKLMVLERDDDQKHPKDFFGQRTAAELFGVRHITAFEVLYLASQVLESEKGAHLFDEIRKIRKEKDGERLWESPSKLLSEGQRTPYGDWTIWDNEPFDMTSVLRGWPVTIDIDQDDKTLRVSLDIWLAGIRDATTYKAPRPFGDKDFSEWSAYGILPAFDLLFWAEAHDVKYTDAFIAKSIWPDESVDIVDRLRKVTKPKLSQIFSNWRTIGRLWRQVELVDAFSKMAEEKVESKN